jgi:hypothetical protein
MKRIILLSIALALGQTYAYADVYVKVDAQGNAIGGAIVCEYSVCGVDSDYTRATLQAGEQYVLQGTGSTGYGENTGAQIKVDIPTQVWTVTTPSHVEVFTPTGGISYTSTSAPAPVVIDTSTATTDTATATVETITATTLLDEEPDATWDWEKVLAWLYAWFEKWWQP